MFFFVVLRFPPWGVSCVSFYSHYRQSKLCSTKKLHIFILFTSFFLRLKFSKTPFHVVLSKNKTNTKKKYHFSLLISVSFHSSQFFFALNLYTSEPLSRQKLTALVYVFVIFWVAFTFFSFFFSRFFFLYFVTKIYFSARARLLHYDPFACITFIPNARECVCR